MGQRLKQSTAVVSVALVLAYVGLTSLSDIRDYAPWPANLLGLSLVSVLCGSLLALIDQKALSLMSFASVLSVLIFGSFWSLASWSLVRVQVSLLELILSDLVFLYVAQRGALLFAVSILFGLIGATGMQILLPDRYHI